MFMHLIRALGRIRVRLLVVNVVVVLVPVFGLEFANLYERQLLDALERDMRNQAVLVRRMVEEGRAHGVSIDAPIHEDVLRRAAVDTRMRIRIVSRTGAVVLDSHAEGAPEGPEPPPPTLIPTSISSARDRVSSSVSRRSSSYRDGPNRDIVEQESPRTGDAARWPPVGQRTEVKEALEGRRGSYTRVRDRHPAVLLFLGEPIRIGRRTIGAVYVVRSTQPVLVELYRIRTGLLVVLALAMVFTLLVTLALAWSISRPLSRLSRAAGRIARGEKDVEVPVGGGGEIQDLGVAFRSMTEKLDQRMQYISDFAADVAHEFKSPLTSIRGAAELLSEGAAEDPEARTRFLKNIDLDVARLDRLVSRLLELSRIEASTAPQVAVDLSALITRAAERHEGRVESTLEEAHVNGRSADLFTAIRNLLDNAVRFSPDDAMVSVTLEKRSGNAILRVADRGKGVPEGDREKVFDRFFTTDSARNGSGLGLAIVRTVMEQHGGQVTLSETEGGGATFTLELPALGGIRKT